MKFYRVACYLHIFVISSLNKTFKKRPWGAGSCLHTDGTKSPTVGIEKCGQRGPLLPNSLLNPPVTDPVASWHMKYNL